jgi:hypothetical protein
MQQSIMLSHQIGHAEVISFVGPEAAHFIAPPRPKN